jgi:hypothetical protein
MSQIFLTRRAGLIAGILACFALALLLFLLALDVARWRDALPADDVRYRAAAESEDLWQPGMRVPGGAGGFVLGVADDVELRRAIRALRLARLEDPTVSDPDLALRRNEAQARLEAIAGGDGPDRRRSQAAGLLGVLGLSRLSSETQDRTALLESTIANLQYALTLDPANEAAKFNLELALQRGRGIQLSEGAGGARPSPGGAGAKGAGAGDPGSGY